MIPTHLWPTVDCQYKNYPIFYQKKLSDFANDIFKATFESGNQLGSFGPYTPKLDEFLNALWTDFQSDPTSLILSDSDRVKLFGELIFNMVKNNLFMFNIEFENYVDIEYKKTFPDDVLVPGPPNLSKILTISEDRKTITTYGLIPEENIAFIYSKK